MVLAAERRKAVFPGSFDPLTRGHVDIIDRSLRYFEHLTIGVLRNPSKEEFFSVEERVELIRRQTENYGERVAVESFSGLLVDFASKRKIWVVIRGLRAISDYDYEAQMALMNKNLCADLETFFLMSREQFSYVSSTLAKQVARYGGDISTLVPEIIQKAVERKLAQSESV